MATTLASTTRPRPGHYVAAAVLSVGMMSLVISGYTALRTLTSNHPNAGAMFLVASTLTFAALLGMVTVVVGIFARDMRVTYMTALVAAPLAVGPVAVFAWALFG